MATMALKSRTPSLGMLSTGPSLIDMPMPSVSVTNKPSLGTSLYHTCRSVLDRLSLVEGMQSYLDVENINFMSSPSVSSGISFESGSALSNSNSNDPLTKLWEICKKGTPLAALFNALNPEEKLKVEVSQQLQVSECKKIVYHFIVACRNQLKFKEEDLFTLSDIYKDNTNGFIKVVNAIELILQLLEEKGIVVFSSSSQNSTTAPKDMRERVIHELLETERKYVQDLEVLQNYMRELQIQEVLNPDTIHYLFGNLNDLVDFQRRFLFYLEEIGEKPAKEQNFGGIFRQLEEQFAVYEPYCSNYFSAQDLVVQEAPKLQKLADILNPVYELPSMLIKPVQRICKYPLLLQQLIKASKPDWPYFEDMGEGLESVKRVTEKVNETQRKYENIQIVNELKRRVDETRTVQQIDSFGSLLLYEKLIFQHDDDSDKEMCVFFFERVVLICKETKDSSKSKSAISIKKKKRGSLQPKNTIIVSRITSVRNQSSGEGNWCLALDWKDRENSHIILLRFRNEEQVKLWDSTINKMMRPTKPIASSAPLASPKIPETNQPYYTYETEEYEEENDEPSARTRPKTLPRNMSADQASKRYNNGTSPAPRASSSAGTTHNNIEFYYPASPPPSGPSSPTNSSRVSQHSSTNSARMREASPLADIASKFMAVNISETEESSSLSLSPTSPSTPFNRNNHPQLPTSPRTRSQSTPNLHHQQQQKGWEDVSQMPPASFNSRTLYQTPPSPSDSSTRETNLPNLSNNNSAPFASNTLKIKMNYNDGIYVIMCSTDITFYELIEKVKKKIEHITVLEADIILRLKYQDEDGDLITINSDDDVQMAFESRGNLNSFSLFVSA